MLTTTLGSSISPSLIVSACRRLHASRRWCTSLQLTEYVQGQSPEPRVREYFYYVDHQGMLFLDDARIKNFTSCFKEKKFLQFFFSRLCFNKTARYPEFPFFSPCGRERNFIRCDDLPLVFTNLVRKDAPLGPEEHIAYGNAGDLMTFPFQPSELCMQVETGRVYHPAPERVGGVGLVRSQLAIQLSAHFVFRNGEHQPPTHIYWNDKQVELSQNLVPVLQSLEYVRKYSLGLLKDKI
ncbi:UPF0598 protein CG30010-like [Procambarus clarkii]|uniref:UPF0598 protein CG30010 n=1 Tax=Procambarus clarkii TaxID=6728 RepID=UPI001E670CC3|nr:UPF0598 protein CG30010-like [Procambarus clarkii]